MLVIYFHMSSFTVLSQYSSPLSPLFHYSPFLSHVTCIISYSAWNPLPEFSQVFFFVLICQFVYTSLNIKSYQVHIRDTMQHLWLLRSQLVDMWSKIVFTRHDCTREITESVITHTKPSKPKSQHRCDLWTSVL